MTKPCTQESVGTLFMIFETLDDGKRHEQVEVVNRSSDTNFDTGISRGCPDLSTTTRNTS